MSDQSKTNSTDNDVDTVSLLNLQILQAEEDGTQADLESLVADGFTIILQSRPTPTAAAPLTISLIVDPAKALLSSAVSAQTTNILIDERDAW